MATRITDFLKRYTPDPGPVSGPGREPGTSANPQKRLLAEQPWLHLIYLLFYFIPWLFHPPTPMDIAVAIGALIIFLPVYFLASMKMTPNYIPHLMVMESLAFATMPFHGMSGTYHIYAMCQAGFQRDKRTAIALLAGLSVVWVTVAFAMQKIHIGEIGLTAFIGILTAIGCMTSAEYILRNETIQRARVLDKQHAALAERERIARDLHDLLGQTLTMVTLKSEVAEKLIRTDPDRAEREIREIRKASRSALKDVRKSVAGMVDTTLEREITYAGEALRAAGINFEITGKPPLIPARADKAAGLALREAVTNIIRHSGAAGAALTFTTNSDGFMITISDNGDGTNQPEGAGLTGLRQRIEGLGGKVSIENNSGACLHLQLPAYEMLS